ncbi:iron complex outermembrane receptor protein [Nitrosospira multiformis]|uniref:Iron complex outermembrane receptor protein n=2 Tax=Nitrosospira multiformis TaxID=1231 RepID=A0A2T5I6X3_9PROT|nr:iron complex outermembrane receptor protein [Nitrosospira multiformis]
MVHPRIFPALIMLAGSAVQAQAPVDLQRSTLPLATALQQLAARHHLSIVFDAETVQGRQAPPLPEHLPPREALDILLANTGLQAKEIVRGRYSIVKTEEDSGEIKKLPEITIKPGSSGDDGETLTVPNTAQATADIQRTPGAVEVVPDTVFKSGPANTIRDVLGWVPGVITQPKSNIDNRVSIRGSGLSRNYGNRGVNVYMDSIPLNTADGLFDVFEIDPSAYRYVEVFKGANALRYGANTLGGAVNFVTPTGHDASRFDARIDAGSFGFVKGQASTGGAYGPYDYFVTLSAQREDGYRDHSKGHIARLNANFGYRITEDAETRFYVNANTWRQQLPGELTKSVALNAPRSADPEFVRQDQQRNIDSVRIANKTTLRFGPTTVDLGLFGVHRHVDHPIFRYLDYRVYDYGGFARATDDRSIRGFRNRLVTGVNVHNGTIDNDEFENLTGAVKGPLVGSTLDKSQNYSVYAENSFFFLPKVALVAGGQLLHAVRDRKDRFLSNGDQSGRRAYTFFSPKVGILWDVDPAWQVFANISRSVEVPTFDANTFVTPASSTVNAQTATTYEIGTRGRRPDITWDLALYRAELKNELQCLRTAPWSLCSVVNADRTVHQGAEVGLGFAFFKAIVAQKDHLWVNVAYTLNDFFFDGDAVYGNNRLPGVPRHFIRSEIAYRHPGGFSVGPNVEWMPQAYFADNANSLTIDPYTLLNFRITYARKGWSGYLEGRNMLDTRYISTTITAGAADATSPLFNSGYGRALYGGIRFMW